MVTYQKNENLQAETQEDGVDKDWEGAHSWLQRYIRKYKFIRLYIKISAIYTLDYMLCLNKKGF